MGHTESVMTLAAAVAAVDEYRPPVTLVHLARVVTPGNAIGTATDGAE